MVLLVPSKAFYLKSMIDDDADQYSVFDGDWYASMNLGIVECRMLYDHVNYSIKMWPGSPARPAEEQEYLHVLKTRLAGIIMQYNFDMLDM